MGILGFKEILTTWTQIFKHDRIAKIEKLVSAKCQLGNGADMRLI